MSFGPWHQFARRVTSALCFVSLIRSTHQASKRSRVPDIKNIQITQHLRKALKWPRLPQCKMGTQRIYPFYQKVSGSSVTLLAPFCFSAVIQKSVEKNHFHIAQQKENASGRGYKIKVNLLSRGRARFPHHLSQDVGLKKAERFF